MNIEKKEINTTTSKTTTSTIRTTIVALTVALLVMMVGSTAVATAKSAPSYYPVTLQANGGTFVNPLMQTWAQGFQQYTGNQVLLNYQAIGTGAAQTDILGNVGAFAGGDAPISTTQITKAAPPASLGKLLQFPEALGGVAIFYNIPGVTLGAAATATQKTVYLNLTGSVVADIYLGTITYWDDPAITSLNPGCSYTGYTGSMPAVQKVGSTTYTEWCTLPHDIITPVHRSDGSGTTYALTNYFEKTSADWNASWTNNVITTGGCPCYSTSISWPAGVGTAAKGSSGVAAYVQSNAYAMGYADSVYALNAGLQMAAIKNQAGQFLVPTVKDIAAAASAFSAQVLANPTFTITNAPGAGSYPISTYTYLYVWQNQANYQQGYDVAQFFEWVVSQGQAYASNLNYAPLPASVVLIDQGIIAQMNYQSTPFMSVTTASVTCKTASVVVGQPVVCTAQVSNGGTTNPPTGIVTWSSNVAGTFSSVSCKLSKHQTYSSCTRNFKPGTTGATTIGATGTVTLTASYAGDLKNSGSGNTATVSVMPKISKTSLSCKPTSGPTGTSIACTVKVIGYLPTGTVTWSQTPVTGGAVTIPGTQSCTLSASGKSLTTATCSETITASAAGKLTLTATYSGDLGNLGSSPLHPAKLTIKS